MKKKKASPPIVMILIFGMNLCLQIHSYRRIAGLGHIFSPEEMADMLTGAEYTIALTGVVLLCACWRTFTHYMPWKKKTGYLADSIFFLFSGVVSCVLWSIGNWEYWSLEMKCLLFAAQTVMFGWGIYSLWKYRKEYY